MLAYAQLMDSPLGPLSVGASQRGVAVVLFGIEQSGVLEGGMGLVYAEQAVQQLLAYFSGDRSGFNVPIDWNVLPDFQRRVLLATVEIPFGEVRTYAQIARAIGAGGAARAVGNAEARNPMPLLVPCHRVVGSDRRMHGYGGPGGIERKIGLLKLEGHHFCGELLND